MLGILKNVFYVNKERYPTVLKCSQNWIRARALGEIWLAAQSSLRRVLVFYRERRLFYNFIIQTKRIIMFCFKLVSIHGAYTLVNFKKVPETLMFDTPAATYTRY